MNQNIITNLKKIIDLFLVINIFIIISASIFFITSIIFELNNNHKLLSLFQLLWKPLFLPSLILFFTAITIELILKSLNKLHEKN